MFVRQTHVACDGKLARSYITDKLPVAVAVAVS